MRPASQCSAASTWRCLGSLVVTTASDAKSTTYKKKNNNNNIPLLKNSRHQTKEFETPLTPIKLGLL
uniref:Uncharacterized protein n=1 Tax=Amphimedon queenslandica TaxID=400682 RepID=A0A1X7T3T9_AMPQE